MGQVVVVASSMQVVGSWWWWVVDVGREWHRWTPRCHKSDPDLDPL